MRCDSTLGFLSLVLFGSLSLLLASLLSFHVFDLLGCMLMVYQKLCIELSLALMLLGEKLVDLLLHKISSVQVLQQTSAQSVCCPALCLKPCWSVSNSWGGKQSL